MATQIQRLEARIGFAIPDALRHFYARCGGAAIATRSVNLLSLSEAMRMLDNWPLYGFEPGYLPLAEDRNGDLYCVRCIPPCQGHVFHLLWSGEDLNKFCDVERFVDGLLLAPSEWGSGDAIF